MGFGGVGVLVFGFNGREYWLRVWGFRGIDGGSSLTGLGFSGFTAVASTVREMEGCSTCAFLSAIDTFATTPSSNACPAGIVRRTYSG